jgi:DNA-binding IclR family transcriptional regulator
MQELGDMLNVSRTTAHRYAKQAADHGLLEQDENGKYFASNNGRGV